jgi:hypothetical protein
MREGKGAANLFQANVPKIIPEELRKITNATIHIRFQPGFKLDSFILCHLVNGNVIILKSVSIFKRIIKWFYFWITSNYIELGPFSDAASCAATRHICNIFCNAKVHYHVHTSPPLVPVLS